MMHGSGVESKYSRRPPNSSMPLRALQLESYARAARLSLEDTDSINPPDQLIAAGRVLALSAEELENAPAPEYVEPFDPPLRVYTWSKLPASSSHAAALNRTGASGATVATC